MDDLEEDNVDIIDEGTPEELEGQEVAQEVTREPDLTNIKDPVISRESQLESRLAAVEAKAAADQVALQAKMKQELERVTQEQEINFKLQKTREQLEAAMTELDRDLYRKLKTQEDELIEQKAKLKYSAPSSAQATSAVSTASSAQIPTQNIVNDPAVQSFRQKHAAWIDNAADARSHTAEGIFKASLARNMTPAQAVEEVTKQMGLNTMTNPRRNANLGTAESGRGASLSNKSNNGKVTPETLTPYEKEMWRRAPQEWWKNDIKNFAQSAEAARKPLRRGEKHGWQEPPRKIVGLRGVKNV